MSHIDSANLGSCCSPWYIVDINPGRDKVLLGALPASAETADGGVGPVAPEASSVFTGVVIMHEISCFHWSKFRWTPWKYSEHLKCHGKATGGMPLWWLRWLAFLPSLASLWWLGRMLLWCCTSRMTFNYLHLTFGEVGGYVLGIFVPPGEGAFATIPLNCVIQHVLFGVFLLAISFSF